MGDHDEGDVPYEGRFCKTCGLCAVEGHEEACARCGSTGAFLEQRWPYDGDPLKKPAIWRASREDLQACARCGHPRMSHRGRGHFLVEDGPCVLCPRGHDSNTTCNAFTPGAETKCNPPVHVAPCSCFPSGLFGPEPEP
jgi:hypothetical protein